MYSGTSRTNKSKLRELCVSYKKQWKSWRNNLVKITVIKSREEIELA